MVMAARAEVHFIIDQAIQNMRQIEDQARATGQTVGGAFTGTEQNLASYNQALNTVGRSWAIAGTAITGAVGLAVNSFMSFEQQMSAVAAVSSASAEDMRKLSDEALRIGQETSYNANEVGMAMEILAKAGIQLEAIYSGVAEGAVRLAEATGINITLASETAAAAMTVFNHTAEETDYVMNIIAQSANASMLSVDDWTSALTYAGPIVSTLGYGIDDLAKMMVILGDAGMRGSVASTSLRNILMQISDSSSKATEGITEYGIALQNADGTSRTIMEIMTDLVPIWNNLNDAARVDMANQWFGARGGPAFLNMMNSHAEAVNRGGDAFTEAGEKMAATGDIYTMSQKRMDNLAGSVERLRGSVETLMINFGSRLAPAIRVVVDALDKLVDTIANLPGWLQTIIISAAALTGGLLLLGGTFMLMLPQILAYQAAMTKLNGLRGVFTLLIGPIRAVGVALTTSLWPITLIAAAVAALYLAWKYNFLGIGTAIDKVIAALKEMWQAASEVISFVSGFFGKEHKTTAELDIKSTTDKGYDDWNDLDASSLGKKANLAITTAPDDMFIEYVYDADGTVIDYEVAITSSTDGTVQTGRILSSSVDPGNPDLVHMEVQLASGETVQGTYNTITGQFSQIDGNVEVTASFVGAAHTVMLEELPNGTKKWNIIEDDTGGTFGAVIDSYSDPVGENSGTAYILIQPEGDGEAFWAKVDLETGKVIDVTVPILGDDGEYQGVIDTITTEQGNETTVFIQGDDTHAVEVISGIMDPATGNKIITLQLANGTTFVAEVDGVTGEIQSTREITIVADTEETASKLDAIVEILEMFDRWNGGGGIIGFLANAADGINKLIFLLQNYQLVWDSVFGKGKEAVDVGKTLFEVGMWEAEKFIKKWTDIGGSPWENRGEGVYEPDTGTTAVPNQAPGELAPPPLENKRTIRPRTTWDTNFKKSEENILGASLGLGVLNGLIMDFDKLLPPATNSVEGLDRSFRGLDLASVKSSSNLIASASAMPMLTRSAQDADTGIGGAASGIASSGLLVDQSFVAMAAGAMANFGAMETTASTQFGNMNTNATAQMSALHNAVSSRSALANSVATAQFSSLRSSGVSQFSTMGTNVGSTMSTLQAAVSNQSDTARANATSQFSQMNTTVGLRTAAMQLSTGLAFRDMASDAKSKGETLRANMVGKMQDMNTGATTTLASLTGIISGAGVRASVTALIAGQNISNSFANGMESQLQRIRNAATAMVNAAQGAILARAMIASPSKLFMQLGQYMGEGVEVGILDKVNSVRLASERLVHLPNIDGGFNSGAGLTAIAAGSTGSVTNHYWVTIPPEAWERMNKDVAKSASFVQNWKSSDAISQYLG